MTTNPEATKVLCYGDSNTWGSKPDKTNRYAADVRWTGQLQKALGPNYYVIEEGLNSRTTNLDYDQKPGRNGRTYLQPCLESHNPLDIVVIMLGTNDLKIQFNRSPEDIAEALEGLVADIKQYAVDSQENTPKIILVSPVLVNDQAPDFEKHYAGVSYDAGSTAKSKLLGAAVKHIADKNGCDFVDASQVAKAGEDGIHFDQESHANLARVLGQMIIGFAK